MSDVAAPTVLRWTELDASQRARALARPAPDSDTADASCRLIVERVRREGDAALIDYAQEFERARLTNLRVPQSALGAAWAQLPAAQREALQTAKQNLLRYHAIQRGEDSRVEIQPGVICESLLRALDRVGIYVPGGSAPLPSTLLMAAVPARLAGCAEVVVCTPPRPDGSIDPAILAAGALCDVDAIYLAGGAQAIAALAFGTATIPRVDKIFGPGNRWVTTAKQLVSILPGGPAIDMPAGPSEVLVVADAGADAQAVAWDLLAQAEHGPDSQVLLVTDAPGLAAEVAAALPQLAAGAARGDMLAQALRHCRVIVVADLSAAVRVSNEYAPEHLVLNVAQPRGLLPAVRHAGSVFLGRYAPVTLGDYCSGTNHVLPTGGHARARGGLGIADFTKRISAQTLSVDGLRALAPVACTLAQLEGLDAHAEAVRCRLADAARTVA